MASSSSHIASSTPQCFLCTLLCPKARSRTLPIPCFHASAHTMGSFSGLGESFSSAWNISSVSGNQQYLCSSNESIPMSVFTRFSKIIDESHAHVYWYKINKSCQVNQILICISSFFWFHRYLTWLYKTMSLTTLPHPTPGCALKGSQISVSLGSPENTSQPRSDSSVLEPNTSSGSYQAQVLPFQTTQWI